MSEWRTTSPSQPSSTDGGVQQRLLIRLRKSLHHSTLMTMDPRPRTRLDLTVKWIRMEDSFLGGNTCSLLQHSLAQTPLVAQSYLTLSLSRDLLSAHFYFSMLFLTEKYSRRNPRVSQKRLPQCLQEKKTVSSTIRTIADSFCSDLSLGIEMTVS